MITKNSKFFNKILLNNSDQLKNKYFKIIFKFEKFKNGTINSKFGIILNSFKKMKFVTLLNIFSLII